MKISYTLSANVHGFVPAATLKTCDDGARAMGSMLREVGRIKFGIYGWLLMAIPSICYYRRITSKDITYNFFLLP